MKTLFTGIVLMAALLAVAAFGGVRHGVTMGDGAAAKHVVKLTAQRFAFEPSTITVKKGEPVVIEITSSDVPHGFALPDFNVQTEISPGKTSRVSFTTDKAGEFTFACYIFCGSGHEEMSGTIKVTE
ncbi:MAG: cupredoxin domain-containing protein [Blastocatellia bacterium]